MSLVAVINELKCDKSPACPPKKICPTKAISQKGGGFFGGGLSVVDKEKCTGCGMCITYCPRRAITMEER